MNSSSNEKCSLIFEYAKALYGAHRAWVQLADSNTLDAQALLSRMNEVANQIVQLGGKVETGTEALRTKGPVVTNADGTVIPYEVGRMESERLLGLNRG